MIDVNVISLALVIAAQLIGAGVVYGAIRADLKNLHGRLSAVEADSDKAHSRIDTLLLRNIP